VDATGEELAIVEQLMAPVDAADGEMKRLIERDELLEPLRRLVAPDAKVEFPVPGGGFVGAMGGPFRGPEGFIDGWREWLQAWDEFRIETEELVQAGDGRVLVLAATEGRLKGTDTSVPQKAAALYTVADGRAVAIVHFLDQDQARTAAGLT
jgi:ketosteroid isomerase-like protein